MASTNSRGQIVTDALSLAGRSLELKQSANGWLNYYLNHVGNTFRFPELRKIGPAQSLAIGQNSVALPADFGLGMDKQGLIFGTENKPLTEYSYEDFAYNNGFPSGNFGIGRPLFYIIDRNAGTVRFNMTADQAYPFFMVYFIKPPLLPVDTSSDNLPIWLDNDLVAVEGLIWMIYKFTMDPREEVQAARAEKMLSDWKREAVKMGGTSRVQPSPSRFKRTAWGGFFGGP